MVLISVMLLHPPKDVVCCVTWVGIVPMWREKCGMCGNDYGAVGDGKEVR